VEKTDQWLRPKEKQEFSLAQMKDGRMVPIGKVKTKNFADALFQRIDRNTAKDIKKGKRIRAVIAHGDNPEQAEQLKSSLKNSKEQTSLL